jgi:hypothetical protein
MFYLTGIHIHLRTRRCMPAVKHPMRVNGLDVPNDPEVTFDHPLISTTLRNQHPADVQRWTPLRCARIEVIFDLSTASGHKHSIKARHFLSLRVMLLSFSSAGANSGAVNCVDCCRQAGIQWHIRIFCSHPLIHLAQRRMISLARPKGRVALRACML